MCTRTLAAACCLLVLCAAPALAESSPQICRDAFPLAAKSAPPEPRIEAYTRCIELNALPAR